VSTPPLKLFPGGIVKSILTRAATVLVTLTAVATLVGGTSSSVAADSSLTPASSTELAALPAGPSPAEVGYRIGSTPEQTGRVAALVATPESRAQLVADLKESFAGVAEVHVETGGTAGRFGAMPDLAYGYNGHFWMTLSYADAANGLIRTAVRYCSPPRSPVGSATPWGTCSGGSTSAGAGPTTTASGARPTGAAT